MECGNIFDNIVVPISTKCFPYNALKRAAQLAKEFDSKVHLLYVIEDNLFKDIKTISSHALAPSNMKKLLGTITSTLEDDAKRLLESELPKELDLIPNVAKKIVKGDITQEIIKHKTERNADLIIMEYEGELLFDQELFDSSTVPIWVEKGGNIKKILMINTNLAPNTRVPGLSSSLQKIFDSEMHSLYVVDGVPRDEHSEKKGNARDFYDDLFSDGILEPKQVDTEVTTGKLSSQVTETARDWKPDLVVLGRIRKPKQFLARSPEGVKRRLSKIIPYNLLLVN